MGEVRLGDDSRLTWRDLMEETKETANARPKTASTYSSAVASIAVRGHTALPPQRAHNFLPETKAQQLDPARYLAPHRHARVAVVVKKPGNGKKA